MRPHHGGPLFNPIPSSEANPLAPVDVAHPPLAMCVAVLIETAGKGSASTLLADGAICKIWGVAGHQRNPPPINPSSSSYGLLLASVAATHHMRAMGGVALSKTAGNARLGGGYVGVVWGRFLCGRVGGRTTTQNQLGTSVSGYWPTTPWHPQMRHTAG
jgi:hypothetical protein